MPQTFYTQEEYLATEQRALTAEKRLEVVEAIRPQWAKGFTSDSVAAQMQTAALQELWEELGAKNQTDAMQRIKYLKVRSLTKFN